MKKIFYSVVLLAVCSTEAMAGGLVTNSNQSASFLRNTARDAVIDIDGVYTNPAGVCFMPNGFHLGLSFQHPEQKRMVTTGSFMKIKGVDEPIPILAFNQNHLGEPVRKYTGTASAPVVPSFQLAYVMDKWTLSASMAVTGGGGKCTFDEGTGSLETLCALELYQKVNALGIGAAYKGYSFDAYMRGRQFYYGFQVGAGYKVNDNLAVFGGLRTMVGSAKYTGYIRDIKIYTKAPGMEVIPASVDDEIDMTTKQSCVGFTPVIGIDYRINDQWNIAAKYEFRTKMSLENSSEMNEKARNVSALDKFNDEKTKYVRDDIPGTFTCGVQYSPIENVRLNAGYHFYDDCDAVKYGDEHKKIDGGTREFLFGAEWDVTKFLTVSAGWQNTHYDLSDEYMSDLNHNLSSNMIVCGVRLHVSEKISVDMGYMHNFYGIRTVDTVTPVSETVSIAKTDVYDRKNDAFAVGVNFDF